MTCLFCKNFGINPCDICRKKIINHQYSYIHNLKVWSPLIYDDLTSKPILQLKYNNNPFIGKKIARWIYDYLNINWNEWDYLVPIPMIWYKYLIRGYNQSYILCHYLSSITHIPIKIILKKNDYGSQINKSQEERIKPPSFILVQDIFTQIPLGSRILLMDDVVTTGVTMLEAYNVLKTHYTVEAISFTISNRFLSSWEKNMFKK